MSSHKAKAKDEEKWRWPLPQDLRLALAGQTPFTKEAFKNVENPALLLQRFVPYPEEKDRDKKDTGWSWEVGGKNFKQSAWRIVTERLSVLYSGIVKEASKEILSRFSLAQRSLEQQGYKFYGPLEAQVQWRLVVGLGLPSPLETGITLHHLYGIPYLPGSAIKGVTRAFRLQKIAEELGVPRLPAWDIEQWEKNFPSPTPWKLLEQLLMSPVPKDSDSEERRKHLNEQIENRFKELKNALENGQNFLKERKYLCKAPKVLEMDIKELKQNYICSFSRAFGSQEEKGEIVFFDAYPISLTVDGQGILELDVINPHYGEYYRGEEPPADWLSPNPVFFLAVRRGTVFHVLLAQRPPCRPADNLLETVAGWVKQALKELGIGAKTRAGYGQLDTELVQKGQGLSKPSPSVALAVENWSPRDMGLLPQIISQLASLPSPERRALAQKLKEKLEAAGRWGGEYREKPWHQKLEELL